MMGRDRVNGQGSADPKGNPPGKGGHPEAMRTNWIICQPRPNGGLVRAAEARDDTRHANSDSNHASGTRLARPDRGGNQIVWDAQEKFLSGHEAGKEIGALPGLGAGKESWEFLF